MSLWNGMRRVIGRARTGASGVARNASIRLDIRNLEGRRDHLLRSIGKRAVALRQEGRGIAEFDAVCRQIEEVETSIASRRADLGPRPEPESERSEAAV